MFQGVICGDSALVGLPAAPKNMPVPVPPMMPGPRLVGISIPYLHFSASRSRSKHPVPILASCPSIMFSDTPFMGSISAWDAASIKMSTVSSKEHLARAPVSCLLMP